MIGELTAQIKGCYRARRWYDLAIEAKNEDTEVGGALQYTALDRILSLEADIARIKVGSTASLIVPVGEYTAPPLPGGGDISRWGTGSVHAFACCCCAPDQPR